MKIILLLFSIFAKGDMFIVKYPVTDTIRGSVYMPLDTITVEDSVTLFSTNLGYMKFRSAIKSEKNIIDSILSVYSRILPMTPVKIDKYIRISIIGEVRTPVLLYVKEDDPVGIIPSLAGGPTQYANLKKLRIISRHNTEKINFYSAVKKGLTFKDLNISSGDVVEVPRRFTINFSNISAAISAVILLWSFYQTNFQGK